jgi:hypothetical protein
MPTDEYWKIENDTLVEDMSALPDRELANELWAGNDRAWEYVFLRSVIPVLKQPKFFNIMHDRGLSSRDVYAMVYENLVYRKKLALFEFRCPVIFWIRRYVIKEILNYCQKNPWPVSDEEYKLGLNKKAAPEVSREEVELAQECFAKLWRQNPMRAYVHLLKVKNEMSAKDIMSLLNVSSESNVNKIFERAIDDIRTFRQELESGGSR